MRLLLPVKVFEEYIFYGELISPRYLLRSSGNIYSMAHLYLLAESRMKLSSLGLCFLATMGLCLLPVKVFRKIYLHMGLTSSCWISRENDLLRVFYLLAESHGKVSSHGIYIFSLNLTGMILYGNYIFSLNLTRIFSHRIYIFSGISREITLFGAYVFSLILTGKYLLAESHGTWSFHGTYICSLNLTGLNFLWDFHLLADSHGKLSSHGIYIFAEFYGKLSTTGLCILAESHGTYILAESQGKLSSRGTYIFSLNLKGN